MSYLRIDDVTKTFKRNTVLDGLSLEVDQGEMLVIFGASGSGKTVLLRLISGIHPPDSGDIVVGGESVVEHPFEKGDVAMAFQNFALYPHMSAFENIASPLRARRWPEPRIVERVHEVARLLRIDQFLDHLPRELSNGQKQRTALARALSPDPSLLLLDDPLRNVDAKLRYEMRIELPRLLREVGTTVLYVTQDYKEAMALGDRIGVLMNGRFRQIGTPAEIYATPETLEIARLFGDPTINLYPCRPRIDDGEVSIDLFGRRLRLDPSLAEAAERDCLIGLRPEHAVVDIEPDDDAFVCALEAVTPLNVRAVLLLKTATGEELLATLAEEEAEHFPRDGGRVWLRLDLGRALLFDRTTGARIAPRTTQGES